MSDCYVYIGYLEGRAMYVGMGSKDRYLHLNSGVSNVYPANKLHFSGGSVETKIVLTGLSRVDALAEEKRLILEYQPPWNSTFTGAATTSAKLKTHLKKYLDLPNKSKNLNLLEIASINMESDYTFIVKSSEFKKKSGMNLGTWIHNFNQSKKGHAFIENVEKMDAVATYRFTFNKHFIDNFSLQLRGVKKQRGSSD